MELPCLTADAFDEMSQSWHKLLFVVVRLSIAETVRYGPNKSTKRQKRNMLRKKLHQPPDVPVRKIVYTMDGDGICCESIPYE